MEEEYRKLNEQVHSFHSKMTELENQRDRNGAEVAVREKSVKDYEGRVCQITIHISLLIVRLSSSRTSTRV